MQLGTLARLLRKTHKKTRSWASAGRAFGISKPMAFRIANNGYDPADPQLRIRLGLPPRPCPTCHRILPVSGVTQKVHRRRIQDLADAELLEALNNRSEMPDLSPDLIKAFKILGWTR